MNPYIKNSTIFKTINTKDDDGNITGTEVVTVLKAKKIAQDELNASIAKHTVQLETDVAELGNLENAIKSGMSYEDAYTQSIHNASDTAKAHAVETKGLAGSTDAFVTKQKKEITALKAEKTAMEQSATAAKALAIAKNALVSFGIGIAISLITKGIEYLATASERAIEKTKELQEEISKTSSDYQSNRKTLEGLREEYDALTNKIGINGAEASLTADEYERYKDITSQILSISPQLITGWDSEGRAISNKNGLLQQSIDLLDEEYQKSLRNNTTKAKNKELASGIIAGKKKFDETANKDTITQGNALLNNLGKALQDQTTQTANKAVQMLYGYLYPNGTELAETGTYVTPIYAFEQIIRNHNDYDKLAESFIDKNNPIYELFSDEVIDQMIQNANEYFQEAERIKNEEEQYYQQFKDGLLNNAKATGDAYNSLSATTQSGIAQMINSFDYSDMTTEKFSEMAIDLKDFVKKLSSDDILRSYFDDLFESATDEESIEAYSSRVKQGINDLSEYCKKHYPAINLDFGDIESNINKLQEKYAATISRFQFGNLKTAQENLQDEYTKIEDGELFDYAEQIKNGTIQSVFGNVDMDDRQVIDWTTDNIEKWKDALSDIKYYDKAGNFIDSYYDQLKESAENGENCIDTVFGAVMDDIKGYNDITAISFSHIVNNDDGTFEFLGRKTAEEYLYGILDAAKQEGDMSIDHILELDKKGLANAEVYDAEGKLIGQTYIHGIISGFNENADDISMLTHFAGEFGAVNLAKQAIEDAKKMQGGVDVEQFFVDNSINTKEEIDYFNKITQGAKTAAEAIVMFNEAKKDGLNSTTTNSITSQIESLQSLTDGFEIIDKIYADVKDKGSFDFGNLNDKKFVEEFSKYTDEYNSFISTVSSSPTDINACQSAFNNLVTAWISGKNALNELDGANKQVAIDMLTNMGVTNATEVVNAKYAKSIIVAKTESRAYQKVAQNENATLKDLADAITYTEDEQKALIAAHPELRNQFKITDDGIKLEENGYNALGITIKNLTVLQQEEQLRQTQAVMDGVSDRIAKYKLELTAIQSLETALSAINSTPVGSAVYAATDYQDYLSMVEENPALATEILTKTEFDTTKRQDNVGVQYGIAKGKLAELQEQVANLDVGIKYGGGKKTKDGSSGSSSGSKKEYEDHREYSDLYDEILSQYEKEIEQIEKENETLQYKYEQALENGDFDIAEQLNRQINNNHKKIKDLRATMAANLRELASEEITPQIIDIAAQFEFDWSGLNIDEISDVEIEQVRQALQDDINHQKDIGVDMENAGQGDNAYNIKTAELALDKFNSLVSTTQNFETAVGNANGEGEQGLKWLEEQEKILENNLKYVKAISDEYQKQSNDIDHQVDLQRNAFNGDDVSFDFINSALEANAEKERIAHDDAEAWRKYYRENTNLTDEEIEKTAEVQDAQKRWWEAEQNSYALYQEAIDKVTKAMENQIKTLEYEYEQQNLIIDALEKKYEFQRKLREEQRDLKAEYEATQDIIAISGDDGSLFNKEDYDTLLDKIKNIDGQMTSLYENYRNDINALSEDEWYKQEEISNEFERQQEALLDQYEIAKKQLEVTRQRTKLENVINNKNKRTLIGGKWVQTADLQSVYEERKNLIALEDEEYELKRTESENKQLAAMRNLNDATNTEAKAIQNRIDMINDMTAQERKALAEELLKVKGMDNILSKLNSETMPKLKTIIDDVIQAFGKLSNIETPSNGYKNSGTAHYTPDGSQDGHFNENGWTPYHTGRVRELKPDEEKAILLKNETVLTKEQAQNVANKLKSIDKMFEPAKLSPAGVQLQNATHLIQELRENMLSSTPPLPSFNIPNVIKNDNSTNQTIEFSGDIIVKEPVQDMNALLHSVLQEAKLYHIRTKNMR